MIPTLKNLAYPERLKRLKLPTLAYRRARGDMIEVYKIVNGIYDPKNYYKYYETEGRIFFLRDPFILEHERLYTANRSNFYE